MLRDIVRKLLKVKDGEAIEDAIARYRYQLTKKMNMYHSTISEQELFEGLKKLDINKGDVIMVHSAWRSFSRYQGSIETVIDMLLELVGDDGTLLMPCYGGDLSYFDVNKTPSQAGALSEVYRTYEDVERSECSHFSVCGRGKEAEAILSQHHKSEFGFDYFSPYYLFSQHDNAKILKLGMGKYPIKTTLIHCMEYKNKDAIPFFKDYLSDYYNAEVINKLGESTERQMVRGTPAKLSRQNITKFYQRLPEEITRYTKIKNLDLRMVKAKEASEILDQMTSEGLYMIYKV